MFGRRAPHLSRCPVCGADGVSGWTADDFEDGIRTNVVLTCGQCSTSRQVVVTVFALDAYQRRLERDRRVIEQALERLGHARR